MRSAATSVSLPLRRFTAGLIFVTCFLSLAPVGVATAECPSNIIWYGCWDWIGVYTRLPGASYDVQSEVVIVPWEAGQPCPAGCYDLRAGLLTVHGHSDPWSECGGEVLVNDEFEIDGLAPGTPVSFFAELWVDGTITGNAYVGAGLAQEWINPDQAQYTSASPVSLRLKMPLSYPAGEKFPVWMLLTGGGIRYGGDAQSSAVLRFSGLPAGAYVTSCQAYNVPVPTLPLTWSRVKATYR